MVETAARIAGRAARGVIIALGAVMQNAPGICGAGMITIGAGLIYRPAAFIVGGAFLLLADWHGARSARR
jgi:hypothetical protein